MGFQIQDPPVLLLGGYRLKAPLVWSGQYSGHRFPQIFRKFGVKLHPLRRFWPYLPQLLSDFQNLKTGIHKRKSLSSGKSWLSSEQLEWRTRTRGVYQNSRVCQFDLLKPDFLAETSHNKRGYLSQYPCKISPSNSLPKCVKYADPRVLVHPRVLVRHSCLSSQVTT